MNEIKKSLVEESTASLNDGNCRKCGSIIVNSYLASIMAMSEGKRCHCKRPQSKA